MDYFFLGNTLYDALIEMGMVLLLAANGFFLYRVSKVKISANRTFMDKVISWSVFILFAGLATWFIIQEAELAGTIAVYALLVAATRIISPFAMGLTEKGIQYELVGSGTGAIAGIMRIVQFVPYKDIKDIQVEETDVLRLKVKFSIRTLTIKFPLEKKEEVIALLKKNNVL